MAIISAPPRPWPVTFIDTSHLVRAFAIRDGRQRPRIHKILMPVDPPLLLDRKPAEVNLAARRRNSRGNGAALAGMYAVGITLAPHNHFYELLKRGFTPPIRGVYSGIVFLVTACRRHADCDGSPSSMPEKVRQRLDENAWAVRCAKRCFNTWRGLHSLPDRTVEMKNHNEKKERRQCGRSELPKETGLKKFWARKILTERDST